MLNGLIYSNRNINQALNNNQGDNLGILGKNDTQLQAQSFQKNVFKTNTNTERNNESKDKQHRVL